LEENMTKRALVTGANRGIGLELCRQLKEKGWELIGACRESSAELDALGIRVERGLDVTSERAVADLARRLEGVELDLLINNAGLLTRESLEEMDYDRIRRQFEVNAIGPLALTVALLPNLVKGAKLILVTSRMGSIGDNTSGGRYGYRMSKAALNIAGVSLAHDLKPRGVAVAILHPGFVRTGMTSFEGFIDPPEAASGLIARTEELTLETSGGFWHQNGERLPW
jgi:NAD(P)-dependent dehydrogenase (short-subunit alcohol dehydrogenase family)